VGAVGVAEVGLGEPGKKLCASGPHLDQIAVPLP